MEVTRCRWSTCWVDRKREKWKMREKKSVVRRYIILVPLRLFLILLVFFLWISTFSFFSEPRLPLSLITTYRDWWRKEKKLKQTYNKVWFVIIEPCQNVSWFFFLQTHLFFCLLVSVWGWRTKSQFCTVTDRFFFRRGRGTGLRKQSKKSNSLWMCSMHLFMCVCFF